MADDEKPAARPAPLAAVLPLIALAGCVDAIGWLRLDGVFVSFISGNSTMLGVAAGGGDGTRAMALGITVALFAAGALAGFGLGRLAGAFRGAAVLGLVAALLLLAWRLPFEPVALPPVAFALLPAMGALNAALPGVGGITFVTGAVTRFAEAAVAGSGWARHLAGWAALVGGAALGGALAIRLPTDALAVPAAWAALGAIVALWRAAASTRRVADE